MLKFHGFFDRLHVRRRDLSSVLKKERLEGDREVQGFNFTHSAGHCTSPIQQVRRPLRMEERRFLMGKRRVSGHF